MPLSGENSGNTTVGPAADLISPAPADRSGSPIELADGGALPTGWVRGAAWAAVLGAGAVRFAYLASNRATFNADEAVTGIMARNILHGHNYSFYPGQSYGGTLEPYLQTLSYLVFRLPQNPLTLRLALVFLGMVTCYLTWLCALRIVPDPRVALVAPAVFAVGPWFNVLGGSTALGFYVAGTAMATGAVYCALRVTDPGVRPLWWIAALGFCSGLALWQTVTTAVLVVPALMWAGPTVVRSRRSAVTWAVAGLAGSLPAWVQLVSSGHVPLPGSPPERTSMLTRVVRLVGPEFREFIGVSYPHDHGGAPRAVQFAAVAILATAYLLALVRRRRRVAAVMTSDRTNRRPVDILLLAPVVLVVMFACSSSAWYTGTPRYLFPAYPLFAIALAAMASAVPGRAGSRLLAVSIVAATAALSVNYFRGAVETPTTNDRIAAYRLVVADLRSHGETRVYADYWTAMPLRYVAGGSIDVGVFHGAIRFTAMQNRVAASADPVYLGDALNGNAAILVRALTSHGITYRTRTVGFVTVFDHLSSPVRPAALGV